MTVPVWKKGLGLQRIHEVRICHEGRWKEKHLTSLKHAYANAPYFRDHLKFVEGMFLTKFDRLIEMNLTVIKHLMGSLRIETKVILLSELGIEARGDQLLIKTCERIGASHFLAQGAAQKYLDTNLFQEAGIQLEFFNPPSLVYPQLWGNFIPNLSAFDLIFNCGPKARDILTGR